MSAEITDWIGTQTDIEERKQAEDAARTVAHDLRVVLNNISVAAAVGQRGDSRWALGRISSSVHRMNDLIQAILNAQRSDRSPPERASTDLGTAVRCAIEDLEPEIQTRGVKIMLPESWPSVRCAHSELYQVMLNLLGNAVRFSGREASAPKVTIECEQVGRRIALRVCDNGPGIGAQHHELVFERGFTLDEERSNTGLGLEIVRRILERNAGTIRIESAPSGGTCFIVHLVAAVNPTRVQLED